MEHKILVNAVIEALGDQKVIEAFANSLSKKVLEQKSKPGSQEDSYVIDHVVFAKASDSKGTYMIAKEIEEALLEINPDFDIRTRTFGKALLTHALDVKNTNKGRAYFVRAIVDDMKKYAETMDVEEEVDETAKTKNEPKSKDKKKEKSKDKSKKKDKGEAIENNSFEEDKSIPTASPEEAFDLPKADVNNLIKMVSGYDTMGEFQEHLSAMSRSKLIKTINEFKLPVLTENYTEDEIVHAIMDVLIANLPKENEETAKDVEEHLKPSKKKEKSGKDKKDKKKDKGLSGDDLANAGKKKDKKKDKKKK